MKYFAFILSFLLVVSFVKAQNSNIEKLTFKVSDVELPKNDLKEVLFKKAIELRIGRAVESYNSDNENLTVIPTEFNAFAASVHFAYSDHRPLVISPDMIWLLICQGFSIHINENSEKYRNAIVNHDGKKKIIIRKPKFQKNAENDWISFFNELSDSIKFNTKSNVYELMVPTFSTTKKDEMVAYQVTLMEGTKKYFDVMLETGCGIPEITLEGTKEDWKKIRENIEFLRSYDLNMWVDNLIPILDEFVAVYDGKINKKFWQSIYKISEHYSPIYSTGWIIKFFPYYQVWSDGKNKNGEWYRYTKYLWNPFIDGENHCLSNLIPENFPSGFSNFQFLWRDLLADKNYEMECYAGFMGIQQNKHDKSLKPIISWALMDKNANWIKGKYEYIRTKDPIEYFIAAEIPASPTSKPIFQPEVAKTYQGGKELLKSYISGEVKKLKANEKLSGKITVEFVITWEGTIARIKVTQNKEKKRESELALNIIKNLPRWKPAELEMAGDKVINYKVNFLETIDISFD
jgi:hypothetical protein